MNSLRPSARRTLAALERATEPPLAHDRSTNALPRRHRRSRGAAS